MRRGRAASERRMRQGGGVAVADQPQVRAQEGGEFMTEVERLFWRSRLAAAHRKQAREFEADGLAVPSVEVPRPSAAVGRSGIPRGKNGLPITESDPKFPPYRARGFGVDPGLYDTMLNTSGVLGGAVALIIREISSAPAGIKIPRNPTKKEGQAAELAARYTGLDGQGGWLRGGLPRHLRQAGRCIPYGFQPFERIWEAWEYPGLPGGVALAPSRVEMRASRSVKGWMWEGDRLAAMVQAYAEAEIDMGMAFRMGLTAEQMGFGGWGYWGKTVAIPAHQLLLYTYDPSGEMDGAPEGRSALRSARRWYELQAELMRDYREAAQRYAWGVTRLKRKYDADGYPVGNASKTAQEDFDDLFAAWISGELDVLHDPNGYEVEQTFPLSKMTTPEQFMRYCDDQMRAAFSAFVMGSGTGTASEITERMLGNSIDATGKWMMEVFNGQPRIETTGLIRPLIDANIDHAGEKFRYPEVYLKGVEHRNLKAFSDLVAKLMQYQSIHYTTETEAELRSLADLSPLNEEQWAERKVYEKARLEMLAGGEQQEATQGGTQDPGKTAPGELPVDDPDGEDDAE